ncbi:enoyl-CoA hydratase/isomerase family protein [Parerythrobacter jejuensis]|uniref:Enoyl-CoA hydratase/isomerase family protein n=1 Tax=Parerythrobacter jejuensis TaxID=795812 RepID=A0A845AM57_9SPHN|nr:enoyl-CoA hydratase-related protein [Parerythrobacter jejuensis]MXP30243.1 enoyl-CoA hydratase/isomerase family protein [Parerythrobacter jejuensis]MXP33003.1 enoyl-CoA hydratase/isomerase family protein [Parerythrobacter jejuensis]
MTDDLLIETRGPIEIATLNRPNTLNAMSASLISALDAYFRGLQDRPEIRVVLFRGAGRAFCAGLDLTPGSWPADTTLGAVQSGWKTQRAIATVMQLMRQCPQPIIALGHGAACGGGFSLLLSSDVRFAAPSLKANAAYIKIGLGGCDMGSSYFLPRLVGASVASEYLLTGKFMTADKARECGLVSALVEEEALLDTGLTLAEEMLATSPMGLRMTKDALARNIDAPSFEAALAIEDRQQVMLAQTRDFTEAKRAFAEKRAPRYEDR